MRIYFAHPVTDYGTERQAKALAGLRAHFIDDLGRRHFEIENPDSPDHQAGYQHLGMAYFRELVDACDALAFMRFPDGSVGAGVAKEIHWALVGNKWLYEVFDGRVYPTHHRPTPILTVEETRELIASLKAKAEGEIHSPPGRSAPSIGSTPRIGLTSDGAREPNNETINLG